MNTAVVRQTLADARRMLLALCLGLGAVSAIDAAVFPSFRQQAALVERLIPSFFRMVFSRVPMDNPEGFVSWALKHPAWVALALTWPIGAAGSVFAGEIERQTLCWVMATPLSRTRYYASKVAAILVGEALALGSGWAFLFATLYAIGFPPRAGIFGIFAAGIEAWLLYSAFAAICVAISALSSDAGRVYAWGIALGVGSLVVNVIADMWSPLRPFKFLSLFSYYMPYEALRGDPVRLRCFLVPLAVALISLIVGWQGFKRRDLAI